MDKKKSLWILLAVFAAVLVVAAVLYGTLGKDIQLGGLVTEPAVQPMEGSEPTIAENTEETQPQRQPAPDFTVTDREGNAVQLSDFRGKPVILNFWASWCGPCKSEMPDFETAYKTYAEQLHFLMVNLTDGSSETVDSASAYVDGEGYTFPVYFDTTYEASIAYGVNSVPMTFVIDEEGYLVAYGMGALDAAALQSGIDMVLPK